LSADADADAAGQILAALKGRGTTARQWALARGYRPRTVYQAIRTWGGRAQRPLGGVNRQILADLRGFLGADFPAAAGAAAEPAGGVPAIMQRTDR